MMVVGGLFDPYRFSEVDILGHVCNSQSVLETFREAEIIILPIANHRINKICRNEEIETEIKPDQIIT